MDPSWQKKAPPSEWFAQRSYSYSPTSRDFMGSIACTRRERRRQQHGVVSMFGESTRRRRRRKANSKRERLFSITALNGAVSSGGNFATSGNTKKVVQAGPSAFGFLNSLNCALIIVEQSRVCRFFLLLLIFRTIKGTFSSEHQPTATCVSVGSVASAKVEFRKTSRELVMPFDRQMKESVKLPDRV